MKLNVKSGDLAVVVNSTKFPQNIGRIVTVGEFAGFLEAGKPAVVNGWPLRPRDAGYFWVVNSSQPFPGSGKKEGVCNDACLRPIRDQPGDDETLSWTAVPKADYHQKKQHEKTSTSR